jgi:hypothetical protein
MRCIAARQPHIAAACATIATTYAHVTTSTSPARGGTAMDIGSTTCTERARTSRQ